MTRSDTAPNHINFSLLPEATISGRVIDADSGLPVPQVGLSLHTVSNEPDGYATTDDDGRFTIAKMWPAIYQVRVADGHAQALQSTTLALALGAHLDGVVVRVLHQLEVRGRVIVAPAGTPCTEFPQVTLSTGRDVSVTSAIDGDGAVHVSPLAAGHYRVAVSCNHELSNEHYDDIVVSDRDVTDRVWTVTAGATVTGRVLDVHGAPIANVTVSADEIAPDDPRHRSADSTNTAADGSYTLSGLRSSSHQLSVQRTHAGPRAQDTIIVALSADHVTHHDFVVDDSASELRGHVRFADATPARGVTVKLSPVTGDPTTEVGTDANGSFAVNDVLGDYRVTLSIDDQPLPLLGADTTGVALHVEPSTQPQLELTTTAADGALRGHGVHDRGEPVDDAFVAVERYDPADANGVFGSITEVLVGTDGSFRADGLIGGPFRVRATRRSGGEAAVQPIAIGADVAVTIAATGSISGVARFAGAPLGEFSVTLGGGAGNQQPVSLDVVGRDGTFTLDGVTPGHYQLFATADVGAAMIEVDVASAQTSTVEVDLARPTHVRGRVVGEATGAPQPNVQVSPNGWTRETYTDASGRFEVDVMPRGAASLSLLRSSDVLRTSWTGAGSTDFVADADSMDLGDIPIAEQE